MTTEQREQLREVLIDHIRLLNMDKKYYTKVAYDRKVAQVRLLLREVA
jgi:thioredoxin-related protein